MKYVESGITTSKEWNACLYVDFKNKKWKIIRFLWNGAVDICKRLWIKPKLNEIIELKKMTDELYLSKHK